MYSLLKNPQVRYFTHIAKQTLANHQTVVQKLGSALNPVTLVVPFRPK